VQQADLTPETFAAVVEELVRDSERQTQLKEGLTTVFPAGANAAFVEVIEQGVKR
jgi:UDP-N-acetylglucosamine:LPS N-acetylglucosamine transferase